MNTFLICYTFYNIVYIHYVCGLESRIIAQNVKFDCTYFKTLFLPEIYYHTLCGLVIFDF